MLNLKKYIGFILSKANRISKNELFYKCKEDILLRFAEKENYLHYQVLQEKCCNRCMGTGNYYDLQDCWSCGGSGVYLKEKLVYLYVYRLDKYLFHIPDKTVCSFNADEISHIKANENHLVIDIKQIPKELNFTDRLWYFIFTYLLVYNRHKLRNLVAYRFSRAKKSINLTKKIFNSNQEDIPPF